MLIVYLIGGKSRDPNESAGEVAYANLQRRVQWSDLASSSEKQFILRLGAGSLRLGTAQVAMHSQQQIASRCHRQQACLRSLLASRMLTRSNPVLDE